MHLVKARFLIGYVMKNIFLVVVLFLLTVGLKGQVLVTQPGVPVESEAVTIVFRADQGTKGLMGYTGEVYAHTGVITSESTSNSDWKYVVAEWDENVEKARLTRIDTDLYELELGPDIRSFYGVPEGEDILRMAFVFRSATKVAGAWKEGKDVGGTDIFVDVFKEGLTALFTLPSDKSLYLPGEAIQVAGSGLNADGLRLYLNNDLVKETSELSLTHNFNAPLSGAHELRLEAWLGSEVVSETLTFYIREAVSEETRPAGLRRGANVVDETTATLVLFAPGKEYVYALGDFNNWAPEADAQMKKDGDYFWLTVTGLEPGVEYAYQYYIDGELALADPYTNKVLDQWNDRYIPERVYPNLKAFPAEHTKGLASVLNTAPAVYTWKAEGAQMPEVDKLVVYELLIRDFTDNGDIKTVSDTLDYLQRLGVNAIELMPFNEFEGNDSWGYNPSFFFATDKAYGTQNDYKAFIDACHERGMVVIMDIVLNHSFSQSPLLQMYFEDGKPAADNPWYNQNHNMQNPDAQWGYDFNHESVHTQALVDSILTFWMDEFRIDGFRFDFTKGFTNTPYGPSSWASAYDASRIALLKRMANTVWNYKDDALVIFEHLSDNAEEKELADHGILLWGNMNHNFSEAVMGYHDGGKSNLSWSSYQARGWEQPHLVAYMESHDEERVSYKAKTYGMVEGSYSVRELEASMKRHQAAAAFLFTVPGPKMIWQFGELGYDISIDEGGRLGPKPPKWNYLYVDERKGLWQVYAAMIDLKKNETVFSTENYRMNVTGAVKSIALDGADNQVRLVGNFDVVPQTVRPGFSSTGLWYNHFEGTTVDVNDVDMELSLEPGEFLLFSSQEMVGFGYVSTVGALSAAETEASRVFPNPASELLHVRSPESLKSWVVYDLHGRMVMQGAAQGLSLSVPTANLLPGLYLLRLQKASGQVEHHKFYR